MCEKKSADESREENSAKTECMWKHVHEKMAKMNLNFMKTARRTCIFFFLTCSGLSKLVVKHVQRN